MTKTFLLHSSLLIMTMIALAVLGLFTQIVADNIILKKIQDTFICMYIGIKYVLYMLNYIKAFSLPEFVSLRPCMWANTSWVFAVVVLNTAVDFSTRPNERLKSRKTKKAKQMGPLPGKSPSKSGNNTKFLFSTADWSVREPYGRPGEKMRVEGDEGDAPHSLSLRFFSRVFSPFSSSQ